ncbi:MAG: hypothetical protein HXY34_00715 [Candidatus Thorarchaeota archaeon]|nr:hypothetical protein [Candidatus Thorarchaeota archaeon]
MDRRRKGVACTLIGAALFLFSLVFVLPVPELYLGSLVTMFIGVVLIGIGGAVAKGLDYGLDESVPKCYYCGGTGRIEGIDRPESCPRCGGTGLGRPDDRP